MEYNDLYDESPYVARAMAQRGGTMGIIRATLLIGAIIAASVMSITFYSNMEDQFVISSGGNYIAVFDKKSKTLNVCDRENCTLIIPRFPSSDAPSLTMPVMKEKLGQFFNTPQPPHGQQLLGSFSPQSQQMPASPSMPPQMMQMPQNVMPAMNPQAMQPMAPQIAQQIVPQMAPQMAQQVMAQMAQQMPSRITPQLINNTTPTTGSPAANADEATDAGETQGADETQATDEAQGTDEAKGGDTAAPDEAQEEPAPV